MTPLPSKIFCSSKFVNRLLETSDGRLHKQSERSGELFIKACPCPQARKMHRGRLYDSGCREEIGKQFVNSDSCDRPVPIARAQNMFFVKWLDRVNVTQGNEVRLTDFYTQC